MRSWLLDNDFGHLLAVAERSQVNGQALSEVTHPNDLQHFEFSVSITITLFYVVILITVIMVLINYYHISTVYVIVTHWFTTYSITV